MDDPHVVALVYKIEHGRSVDYQEADPQDHEADNFSVRIEDGKVCFTMKPHARYATVAEAQEAVREYIRCWEFDVYLRKGPNRFRLEFDRPEIEDRKPSPALPVTAGTLSLRGFGANSGQARLTMGTLVVEEKDVRSPYPPPPSGLAITPDVQSMFDRFMAYRSGQEKLPGMANFWLTLIEARPNQKSRTSSPNSRRAKAAKKYGIDLRVLDEIGNLSAKKGGPQAARKKEGIKRPLTASETRFLEEAIAALTRRVAEVEHDIKNESYENKNLKEIKLSDFRRKRRR